MEIKNLSALVAKAAPEKDWSRERVATLLNAGCPCGGKLRALPANTFAIMVRCSRCGRNKHIEVDFQTK